MHKFDVFQHIFLLGGGGGGGGGGDIGGMLGGLAGKFLGGGKGGGGGGGGSALDAFGIHPGKFGGGGGPNTGLDQMIGGLIKNNLGNIVGTLAHRYLGVSLVVWNDKGSNV